VHLGSLRLIAESMELIDLLSFLRRCLGRAAERQEYVDQALQSLRDWAGQRGELVVVATGICSRWCVACTTSSSGGRAFTWCKPAEGTNAAAVVKAAATGTLCVDTRQRQEGAMAVVEHVHGTEYVARPQLVLCTADPTSAVTLKGGLEDRP